MTRSIHLHALVNDQAEPGLTPEHGFAAWLQVGDRNILFDTGQGPALPGAIEKMGLDPSRLDALVLSHGHYDHTGGVAWILDRNARLIVHAHPGCFDRRYSVPSAGQAHDISMPTSARTALKALSPNRLRLRSDASNLFDDVGLTGAIPHLNDFEDVGGPFYLDPVGVTPDPIADDQTLWLETDSGVVLLTGCCHAGLLNTIAAVQDIIGGKTRIRGIAGGLHLARASTERLDRTARALQDLDLEFIAPTHCAGENASAFLRDALGPRVRPLLAGQSLTI